jgi:histidyl-tRNA synthetase
LNSSIPESLLKVIFDLSLVYNYTYYDGIMFQAVREALPAITPSLTRSDDSVSSADPCTLFLSLFPLPSKKKKKQILLGRKRHFSIFGSFHSRTLANPNVPLASVSSLDIVAAGGRYDRLVSAFQTSATTQVCAVGVNIAVEKIAACVADYETVRPLCLLTVASSGTTGN